MNEHEFIVTDNNNEPMDLNDPKNKEIKDLVDAAGLLDNNENQKNIVWDPLTLTVCVRVALEIEHAKINEDLSLKTLRFLRDISIHLKSLENLEAFILLFWRNDKDEAERHMKFLKSLWEMQD